MLQAIRENPFRAEALGYRIVFHRTLATCLAAAGATAAGALNALWLRYVGPDTALAVLDPDRHSRRSSSSAAWARSTAPSLGAALFVVAQNYLQALLGALSAGAADAGLPLLTGLFHPDRWLLWLGLLFVLAVYFVPAGMVGALRSKDEAAP